MDIHPRPSRGAGACTGTRTGAPAGVGAGEGVGVGVRPSHQLQRRQPHIALRLRIASAGRALRVHTDWLEVGFAFEVDLEQLLEAEGGRREET